MALPAVGSSETVVPPVSLESGAPAQSTETKATVQSSETNEQTSCIRRIWNSFVECLSTIFSCVCCPCNYVLSWISGKTSEIDAKVQQAANPEVQAEPPVSAENKV